MIEVEGELEELRIDFCNHKMAHWELPERMDEEFDGKPDWALGYNYGKLVDDTDKADQAEHWAGQYKQKLRAGKTGRLDSSSDSCGL